MAQQFGWDNVAWRGLLALVVVFGSFNPTGWSFWHWISAEPLSLTPGKGIVGVLVLIGWAVLLRATINSLGLIGLVLAGALFGFLIWGLVSWGVLPTGNWSVLIWIVELMAVLVLTAGVSWSHVRRRLSGQIDVDDVETG